MLQILFLILSSVSFADNSCKQIHKPRLSDLPDAAFVIEVKSIADQRRQFDAVARFVNAELDSGRVWQEQRQMTWKQMGFFREEMFKKFGWEWIENINKTTQELGKQFTPEAYEQVTNYLVHHAYYERLSQIDLDETHNSLRFAEARLMRWKNEELLNEARQSWAQRKLGEFPVEAKPLLSIEQARELQRYIQNEIDATKDVYDLQMQAWGRLRKELDNLIGQLLDGPQLDNAFIRSIMKIRKGEHLYDDKGQRL